MYAIIKTGGKQYKVTEGDVIRVEKLECAEGDQITFDMELSTRDTLPDRTFIIEDKAFFADQLIEVVPPYLEQLGSFDFKKGRYPNRHWQVSAPTYRYSFDPAALRKESAAITTFALLLN